MNQTAFIFLNGNYADEEPLAAQARDSGLVIGVDGGTKHLLSLKIIPRIIIGDMDSLPADQLKLFENQGVEVIRHPTNKDETDFELALDYALLKGYKNIQIFGATGGRLDHMLANILLPVIYSARASICIIRGTEKLIYITDKATIKGNAGDQISLIPVAGVVTDVKTLGLLYPLNGEDLVYGRTRGMSNEMLADEANVSIASGILLCIYTPQNLKDERERSHHE